MTRPVIIAGMLILGLSPLDREITPWMVISLDRVSSWLRVFSFPAMGMHMMLAMMEP